MVLHLSNATDFHFEIVKVVLKESTTKLEGDLGEGDMIIKVNCKTTWIDNHVLVEWEGSIADWFVAMSNEVNVANDDVIKE